MDFFFFSPLECALSVGCLPPVRLNANLLRVEAEENAAFTMRAHPRFYSPSGVLFDSAFDKNVDRYPFLSGELILPRFQIEPTAECKDLFVADERIYGQEYVVNAHIDGFTKITVTGFNEQSTVAAPVNAKSMTLNKRDEYLAVVLNGDSNFLALFRTAPLKCVFLATCSRCELGENFAVETRFRGALDYVRRDEYAFSDPPRKLSSRVVFDKKRLFDLHEYSFLKAFFEVLSLGGDVTPFLHPSIKDRAKSLCDFIGGIKHVIPRCTRDYAEFYLVGETIKRATAQTEDGLIFDVEVT